MQTYIGVLKVEATAMTRGAFARARNLPCEDDRAVEDGYLVVLQKTSFWLPADHFENNYKLNEGLTFGNALDALKVGKRVARAGWNGRNQWVVWVDNSNREYRTYDDNLKFPTADCLALKNAQDIFVPGWVPSQGDLLAEDWLIVG